MAQPTRKRILFAATAAAAMAFAVLSHAAPAADAGASSSPGVVGVCVRWGDDTHHLAEAVVVEPSGIEVLDSAVPNTLRSMTWDKPDGYDGQWLGLSVGVDGAKPADELPDCGGLDEASVHTPLKAPIGKQI